MELSHQRAIETTVNPRLSGTYLSGKRNSPLN